MYVFFFFVFVYAGLRTISMFVVLKDYAFLTHFYAVAIVLHILRIFTHVYATLVLCKFA